MQLPIDDVLSQLMEALEVASSAVLQAPSGAGKTTRVPLSLLQSQWLGARKIIMLEPRRLAARAAASFMARQLGENAGGTVGYRIRFDTKVSARTRVEVVTEGVLTRMLQADPALENYGAIIFDEFHERSLHADLGLALALQSRHLLRPDLRLLVMSATMDGDAASRLLGDAPVISSSGRAYAVETIFAPRRNEGRLEVAVARAVLQALHEHDGDVLVFLPGAREIHRTMEQLAPEIDANTRIAPLYGNLPQPEQDFAIAASPAGKRKVVLATSIAETSLTIEGVRVVVDSGLMRVPRFDARTGMTRLETVAVTRASADQRRGRAGRTAPGVCYRLWSRYQDDSLIPHSKPEILDADLAPLALDLAIWGVKDPHDLQWIDPPPHAAFAQAREILFELGALDHAGVVTEHGRTMAQLPSHPRLAHMLLRAREIGLGALAADIAAMIDSGRPAKNDAASLARMKREAEHLRALLRVRESHVNDRKAGLLLAFAYPDRIAKQRGSRGKFLLRNGRGAFLEESHPLSGEPFIVAAELEGSGRDSRIYHAARITEAEIREFFSDQIAHSRTAELSSGGSATALEREMLGAITLKESAAQNLDASAAATLLLEEIRKRGIASLNWTKSARQFQQRVQFLHRQTGSFPDFSDESLHATMDEWLRPHLGGIRNIADIQKLDVQALLEARLDWKMRRVLHEEAPTHLVVPAGSHVLIDYTDPDAPFAAVRLQELFGSGETPRLAGGRVPLTIHLLSPARRPVQVTRDLASFWKSAYFEVKKELKGRYPKHHWPDDPLRAEAVRGTKRKPPSA